MEIEIFICFAQWNINAFFTSHIQTYKKYNVSLAYIVCTIEAPYQTLLKTTPCVLTEQRKSMCWKEIQILERGHLE